MASSSEPDFPQRISPLETSVEVQERCPLLHVLERSRSIFEKLGIVCLALILVVGVGIGTYLLVVEGRVEGAEKFVLVPRNRWTSINPLNMTKLIRPVQKVLILQTNTSRCWNEEECCGELRNLQKHHIEKLNELDILYNFIVGDDGHIYEGRGWEYQSIYRDYDKEVLSVAFLGNYNEDIPSNEQSEGLKAFLDFAVMRTDLIPCYDIIVKDSGTRNLLDMAFHIKENVRKENKC